MIWWQRTWGFHDAGRDWGQPERCQFICVQSANPLDRDKVLWNC